MGNKCTVDGCDRKRYGHGWCQLHWKRMKRSGTLDANQQYSTTAERLDGRSRWEGDCLVWTGAKSDGYGTWTDHGKKVYAHRAAWERENGAIPDGKHIDHLCWNRACILPDHLRAVTQAENNQNWQGARADSTTGIRGVHFRKKTGKWMVTVKGKYVGVYATVDEAERAAVAARKSLMKYTQN